MGFDVVLEDECGRRVDSVGDPTNILHLLLPSQEDESFHYLNHVDWYGDTVFNRQQMPTVLQELARIAEKARCEEEDKLIRRLIQLARSCESTPHLYLKFYGD